jgi:hypothetical protein
MKAQSSGTKRWQVVIPVIIIALVVGWYWFRPGAARHQPSGRRSISRDQRFSGTDPRS